MNNIEASREVAAFLDIIRIKDMYAHYRGRCFVCGKPATQRAHIIGNTELNKKLYGLEVVNNILNYLPACSLECNGKIDIGRVRQEGIAMLIEGSESVFDEARADIEEQVILNIKRKEMKHDRRKTL